jgi:hypothetical protein
LVDGSTEAALSRRKGVTNQSFRQPDCEFRFSFHYFDRSLSTP